MAVMVKDNRPSEEMEGELLSEYEAWMVGHIRARRGENRNRLLTRSHHAEKLFIKRVWWPAFGQLHGLHPEYEIKDYKDGWRYLDFAYVTEGIKLCIEIDSYGRHCRELNKSQFSDHLMRQNHLVIDGWLILRFSYDDMMERPRNCQQIIQQLLGKIGSLRGQEAPKLNPTERAILRLAASMTIPISPLFASKELGLHRTTILRTVQALVGKGLLLPTRKDVRRVCSYRINKALLPRSSL